MQVTLKDAELQKKINLVLNDIYKRIVKVEKTINTSSLEPVYDKTGGSASKSLAAVSGSGDDTNINNNFASVNADLTRIKSVLKSI